MKEYFITNWPWILGAMLGSALMALGIDAVVREICHRVRQRRYRRTHL